MDKKEARAIVREWLKDVSAEVGWKLNALTIWKAAAEWRIGIRLRPSTWGAFFFVDCHVFMNSTTAITSTDSYTIDVTSAGLARSDASLRDAVDFDGRQSQSQIATKATLFKQIMCNDVVPRMSRFVSRPALERWMRRNPYSMSAKLRQELGISAPAD